MAPPCFQRSDTRCHNARVVNLRAWEQKTCKHAAVTNGGVTYGGCHQIDIIEWRRGGGGRCCVLPVCGHDNSVTRVFRFAPHQMGGVFEDDSSCVLGVSRKTGNSFFHFECVSLMTIMRAIIVTCQLMASRRNGCCVTTSLWPVAMAVVFVGAFCPVIY